MLQSEQANKGKNIQEVSLTTYNLYTIHSALSQILKKIFYCGSCFFHLVQALEELFSICGLQTKTKSFYAISLFIVCVLSRHLYVLAKTVKRLKRKKK